MMPTIELLTFVWLDGLIMGAVIMTWLDFMMFKGFFPKNPWRREL